MAVAFICWGGTEGGNMRNEDGDEEEVKKKN